MRFNSTYILTDSEKVSVQYAIDHADSEGYAKIYEAILNAISDGDGVKEGVDPRAAAWLTGAIGVNTGTTLQSDFIRIYSDLQYRIRFGEASTESIQDVSNEVARKVGDDAVHDFVPDLTEIGESDANAVISLYFNDDDGGWSGNHLFLFLDEDGFYKQNIINSNLGGYELSALLKATSDTVDVITGYDTLYLPELMFQTAFVVGSLGSFTTTFGAIAATNAFVHSKYGISLNALTQYEFIFGNSQQGTTILGNSDANALFGGTSADVLSGDLDQDLLDGGDGNDMLAGGAGSDILVGGNGNDVLVGGDLSSFDPAAPVDLAADNAVWDDGQGDELRGGVGNDTYLISIDPSTTWDWAYLTDANGDAFQSLLDVIDTIDEGNGDGIGQILLQTRNPSAEDYTPITVEGDYTPTYEADGVQYYYSTSNAAEIAVVYIQDESGLAIPYAFVLGGGYPLSPLVAIKDFYNGDFGIHLDGYSHVRTGDGTGSSGGDADPSLTGSGSGGTRDLDTVDFSASSEAVHVNLADDTATGGLAEGANLTSIENVIGSSFADTLIGGSEDNYLLGGDGNDLIVGGGGDDLIDMGKGDDEVQLEASGNVTVSGGDGFDVLRVFGAFADFATAAVHEVGYQISATGFYALLVNVERVIFDVAETENDVVIDLVSSGGGGTLPDVTVPGTPDNDTLEGTWGDDVFHGGLGNDTLLGSAGSDIYLYSSGDGNDYIDDEAGFTDNTDVLRFLDLNPSDVSLAADGVNLVITVNSTGETITSDEQFYSETDYWGLERIEFADGTSWDRAEIMAQTPNTSNGVTIPGTSGDDTLEGTWGDDVFHGGLGNDTLLGSAGSDIYLYSSGDGNDYIDDEAGFTDNTDVLRFLDLNRSDVSLTADGVNLVITVNSTGETITSDEQFYSETDYWGLERIEFADGSYMDRDGILTAVSPPNISSAVAPVWELA